MSELFSILIDSRARFETGQPSGEWLTLPTTTEQLHVAMQRVGITADNPQDLFINGIANTEDCPFDVPLSVIQNSSIDELNYLGKLLEMQSDEGKGKFAAAVTHGEYAGSVKDLINLAQNLDYYWIYPTVQSEEDYGYYLIDELDELELPAEAKKYFMYEEYGRDAAINDGGRFTEQGYIYNNKNTFSEWYDGRDVPQEYSVMSFPQPETKKADFDTITTRQTATLTTEPQQPRPVIPLVLTSEKPAEKMKEITDRLEQGIKDVFESERYKEYLTVMSKFHNYSFRNTFLIAMQKPDASRIAGFNAWKNDFDRNVKYGEKGIKIIAPSPYKMKKEMEKIDPTTQQPVRGKDGKPVTEEQEITIPAFKVVSVFDVSQTEGKELPDIAVDALTGDVEHYKEFFTALEQTAPVPVGFEKTESGTQGYYHLEDKRIALSEDASELQTLKTLIHEIAHAKLHDIDLNAPVSEQQNRPDRRTREVEAESIAYAVCQHYGLDTSDYSFGYVAGWSSSKELAELKGSLETIRSTADELINTIDGHIAELQKSQEVKQEQPAPEQTAELSPDPTITVKEMQEYGYDWNGMLPLQEAAAVQLFEKDDMQIYRLYGDGSEGAVESIEELRNHAEQGGIFGIEKDTWNALTEYKAMQQELSQSEAAKEALLFYGKENTFGIYQLKGGDETRDYRFEPYERLQTAGLSVDAANYELTYTTPLESGMTLEGIFERFNLDRPADFTGHSLSVSDVVVLHQDGQDTAHYVDSIGYKEVPEFLQPTPTLATEQPQEVKPETSVTYYPINETAARRAKEANSYSDYKPGSATAEYRSMVDEAVQLAERQKARVDPMHHEKIDRLLDTYARKLAENMNNSFAIESRVPSILITGGGNFPVRKKEKQNVARDKNTEEWQDIRGLLGKIRSTGMGGISADDPNAVQKLEAKLSSLEQSQETMKAVNAYYRKNKTLDGCTLMPPEQLEKLKENFVRFYPMHRQPFPSYSLTNNNAEIRRTKARIEELTRKAEQSYAGWEFDGGKVEVNKEENRLQVFFDEKPDEEKRTELKSNGFRWSPNAGAWQRQLNSNAFFAANYIKCIQPLTGERPTDLQRKVRQEQQVVIPTPDNLLTGETVHTPRGNFRLTSMTQQEIEAAGYGFHHQSDDGKYFIMGNGTQAFAIQNEAVRDVSELTPSENPLAMAEKSTEQNYNMIDGVINNTPTVDELEAKAKAGEQISLSDLAAAIKTDKQRSDTPKEKPSIRAQLKEGKEKAAPKKTAAKQKNNDLEV